MYTVSNCEEGVLCVCVTQAGCMAMETLCSMLASKTAAVQHATQRFYGQRLCSVCCAAPVFVVASALLLAACRQCEPFSARLAVWACGMVPHCNGALPLQQCGPASCRAMHAFVVSQVHGCVIQQALLWDGVTPQPMDAARECCSLTGVSGHGRAMQAVTARLLSGQ